MNRYRTRQFDSLAAQLERGPRRLVLRYLNNIEFALSVLAPQRRYPIEFAWGLVTGLRPQRGALEPALVRGVDLRHDLSVLAEHLSARARLPMAALGGQLSLPEQLAARFRVSRKTISRWRMRGLTAWKVVGEDGRQRVAFPERSVRRFVGENSELIRRASSFTQLTEQDQTRIVELARETIADGSPSRNAVIERVALRVGRARETVRQVLMRHDRENPQGPLFGRAAPAEDGDWRQMRIWEAFNDGASIEAIARQFDVAAVQAYAVITRMRAVTLQNTPIEFVDAKAFRSPGADERIRNCPDALQPFVEQPRVRVPADLPPLLKELYRRPLLTPAGERALFRKMNYLKYRADQRRQALDPATASASELDQLEALLEEAGRIKNQIICANLRLVVHVARRHVAIERDLFELISDGSEVLMRAVERFDYARGFKFSTYCSWSLMRRYARRRYETQRRRALFVTGQDDCLRDYAAALPIDDGGQHARELIARMAGELNERQWAVLRRRYGLDGDRQPRTLTEIGVELGVSKERVRQIESESLSRLRSLFGREIEHLLA